MKRAFWQCSVIQLFQISTHYFLCCFVFFLLSECLIRIQFRILVPIECYVSLFMFKLFFFLSLSSFKFHSPLGICVESVEKLMKPLDFPAKCRMRNEKWPKVQIRQRQRMEKHCELELKQQKKSIDRSNES